MDAADPLDPDTVHDRESFLVFVRALVADREAAVEAEKPRPTDPRVLGLVPDAGGWYNFPIDGLPGRRAPVGRGLGHGRGPS